MLKFLPQLEAALLLAAMLGLYYSTLGVIPSFDLYAYQFFFVKQTELLTVKAGAEAFSYDYFLAVRDAFDPAAYSDQTSEQWSVPAYFSYPAGGSVATCQSVDGDIGCTVWNLENAGEVCPDVVAYTPNPSPSTYIYPAVSVTSTDTLISALAELLSKRGINSILDVNVSSTLSGNTYTLSVEYNLSLSGFSEYRSSGTALWTLKPSIESEVRTARCVCDGSTVATYDVNTLYITLEGNLGEGNLGTVPLLKEGAVFIRYFLQRTSYTPPATVNNCQMVFE
ncbi:MAG: hypothetical protein GXO00_00890 [Candidatus Diapherotrites archaeon]|nr:hypothetical protein [Candidatus Diapherotrites archaeon]